LAYSVQLVDLHQEYLINTIVNLVYFEFSHWSSLDHLAPGDARGEERAHLGRMPRDAVQAMEHIAASSGHSTGE
jgi:hypothetical protein